MRVFKQWANRADFFSAIEEYIARYEPDKTVEQILVEMQVIVNLHLEFDEYCKTNNIRFDMPKKKEATLERRKAFINWYVERHQNDKMLKVIVADLEKLTFTSQSTIYHTLDH